MVEKKPCEGCGQTFQPVIFHQRFCSTECIPHGTKAGYEAHKRTDRKPCDLCRQAHTVYQREWRNKNRESQRRITAGQRARDRALRKLAQQYPRKFKKLYDAELAAMEEVSR